MVEPVVDPAASDRHRATSASVAVGSLHTNKTAHGAGRGAKLRWLPLSYRSAYDGSRFLRPESVAQAVLLAVTAPPDADATELSIRPAPR